MNASLLHCSRFLVAHVTASPKTPPAHERPRAPRPSRSGCIAALATAVLLWSCASPTSDSSGTGGQRGGSSGATGTGGLAGAGAASGGATASSSGGAGGSSGSSSAHGSGGSTAGNGGLSTGAGGVPVGGSRRSRRGARWLRCGRIDDVRGINRNRRLCRCLRWPGRVRRRGHVWKGRSIGNGGQCRNRRRRQRR
jgi:hypothetical protein